MSETDRRAATVIADELFMRIDRGRHVKPGYILSSNGDDNPPIEAEAKAAFQRHRDQLPKGARVVDQVTIKGYPVTFYDMPAPRRRSFLARLADSVRGQK